MVHPFPYLPMLSYHWFITCFQQTCKPAWYASPACQYHIWAVLNHCQPTRQLRLSSTPVLISYNHTRKLNSALEFHTAASLIWNVRSSPSFQTARIRTARMRPELTFYEWLTLYSLPLWEFGKIFNFSTTSPVESLTYLWSFNFVSWKLCESTSNLRFLSD